MVEENRESRSRQVMNGRLYVIKLITWAPKIDDTYGKDGEEQRNKAPVLLDIGRVHLGPEQIAF